jgi:EmrB/QacA subfamily drug resistance transporter
MVAGGLRANLPLCMASASAARWVLVATIVASSMTFIDGTVVNVALPALQAALHATLADVQWVVEAYALFLGALILVGGSMGDQFGRRRVFLWGVAVFTAASVVCGIATSIEMLIVARAVQGIGAALLVPGSLAIISATFTGAERGRAIGVWSGFSAITTAIGPVTGGWLVEHVSWRAVFFLNVPLAAVVLILSWRFMDESSDPSRAGSVDWRGGTLAVVGLGGVVVGLLEWPALGAGHPLVIASLVVGVAMLVVFVVVERGARNPMFSLELLRVRTFTLANVLTLLLYGALGVVFFLVPLDLIQVQRYSPAAAGAAILPLPIIMFILSRWSGGLVARTGARLPLTVGPIVAAVGFVLYARPGVGGSYWTTFFPAIVVLGLGMAVTVAPLTTTVMGAVGDEHAGMASGVNNAVSRVAGLLTIAVFGVVLSHIFVARLRPQLARIATAPTARAQIEVELPKMAGAEIEKIAQLQPQQRTAIRAAIDESFVSAFRVVVLCCAVLAAASAVAGAGISHKPSVPRPGQ